MLKSIVIIKTFPSSNIFKIIFSFYIQIFHNFITPIYFRGAVYADMGHFERCITLWMYALDMQQKILEPLSPMTQSSLLSFAELFSFMMSEGGRLEGGG